MVIYRIGGLLARTWHHRGHLVSLYLAFLIIAAAILPGRSGAQSFVSLSSGMAAPAGSFTLQEYPEGGFALTGASFSIRGAWFFNRSLGIGGMAGLFANPVEAGKLADEKMAEDPFLLSLVIRTDPYRIFFAAPGFFYRLPISPRFSSLFSVKAGAAYSISPYQLHKPEYYVFGDQWFEITSSRTWSWMAGLGGGISYHLSDCLTVAAEAGLDYIPVEWRFLMLDGSYRYQAHDVFMITIELGIKLMIGAGNEE